MLLAQTSKRIMLVALFAVTQVNLVSAQQRQFYDSNGNFIGSSNTNAVTGQTYFYGQQGQILGNTNPGGAGQTIYYDAQGNNVGSTQETLLQE